MYYNINTFPIVLSVHQFQYQNIIEMLIYGGCSFQTFCVLKVKAGLYVIIEMSDLNASLICGSRLNRILKFWKCFGQ